MPTRESKLEEILSVCDQLLAEGKGFRLEEVCRDDLTLMPEVRRRLSVTGHFESLAREEAPPSGEEGLETTAGAPSSVRTLWPEHAAIPAPDLMFLRPPEGPGEIGRLGPFRVLGVLGRGGMGIVLRAEDPALVREVALKCMKPELAASREPRERFLREARAAARIDDPHVAPIHQVDEARGVPYLVMPLLRGQPLSARLSELRAAGQAMPPAEAARTAREMALGLAAAHALGVIHRDIKPANVWLKEGGGAVLLDFGLASVHGAEDPLTQTGQVLGTPSYMSPEQAEGREAGPQSDLFSLGAVLYEMLAGERAFSGPSVLAILGKLSTHTPPTIASAPPPLAALTAELLSRDPAARPASAAEVARRLERFEHGEAEPRLPPWPRPEPPPPAEARTPYLAIGLGGAVLLALAAALAFWPRNPSPTPPPEREPSAGADRPLKMPREMTVLTGSLRARVWSADGMRAGAVLGVDPAAVPVREGDMVRIEADFSEPAHAYVVWLAADGGVIPLYPWSPGDELVTEKLYPAPRIPPAVSIATPSSPGKGWTCDDSDGLETILVLASRDPIPATLDLGTVLTGLPRNRYVSARENTIQAFREGKLLSEKPSNWAPGPRGIKGKGAGSLDDALLTAVQRLTPHFELIQAVRFAHVPREK
jgi:serine/threonine protein kinase